MEITATPSRGRRRVLIRLAIGFGVALLVALLTPAALGLQLHPVSDDAMGGSYPRGTLVVDELVPVDDLAVGDVITLRAPSGPHHGAWVTRRIDDDRRGRLVTRGDASRAADPWRLGRGADELRLVAGSVPLLGFLWLAAGAVGGAGWLLLLGAATLAGAWVRGRRPAPGRAVRSGRDVAAPGAPAAPV